MKPKICSVFFQKKLCRYFAGPFVSLAEASQSWKVPNGLTWLGKEEALLHDIRLGFVRPFLVINYYQDDDDIFGGLGDHKPKPFIIYKPLLLGKGFLIPHLDEVRLTGLTMLGCPKKLGSKVRINGL